MISYDREMLARERMRDLLAEAARERLARQAQQAPQAQRAQADPHVDGPWRARLAGAFVRRLTRIAAPF